MNEKFKDFRRFSSMLKNLSIDMVEKANSGHPGAPMGMADFLSVLILKYLNINPFDSNWLNRDRLIFSNGHASALLYSILFCLGYKDITFEDLKNFRKLGSKTEGHPEFGLISGIETTTGPLGQGLAASVGVAIASKKMQSELSSDLINHKIYTTVGDGCLMEGVSHEAASLAGHLGLDNLIVLFDSNSISIDGDLSLVDSTNTKMRFESYGWEIFESCGHDFEKIENVFELALNSSSKKPILIIFKTIIGNGANKKQGSASSHGAPLGKEECVFAKKKIFDDLELDHSKIDELFLINQNILDDSRVLFQKRVEGSYESWIQKFKNFKKTDNLGCLSKDYFSLDNKSFNDFFDNLVKKYLSFESGKKESTRKSSGIILEELIKNFKNFIGGSADLGESNCVLNKFSEIINKSSFSGNYIHFGVREHAASAICNGIACYNQNYIPFVAGFLIFSDYARPSIRLAALMKLQILMIFTHDSIFLGEDGPTHQPIEQLASLRAIPNLLVFRPADFFETLMSYKLALLNKNRPSVLALSRQNLPFLKDLRMNSEDFNDISEQVLKNGAYIVSEKKSDSAKKKIIILSTGSEVSLSLDVLKEFENDSRFNDLNIKVISILCSRIFDESSTESKEFFLEYANQDVLGLVAIEAADSFGWSKYIGSPYNSSKKSLFIGVENRFGSSGKENDLREFFGLSKKSVFEKIVNEFNLN